MGFADTLLTAAMVPGPDGTQATDDKYLAQVLIGLDKSSTALLKDANDTIAKQRMEALKRRVELRAQTLTLIGKIENVREDEREAVMKEAQLDLANIRNNYIKLVAENPAVIGSITTRAEQTVVSMGETNQAKAAGWDALLGDLNNLGVVSVGNPEVIAVYQWALKRLGPPEDLADDELKRRAIEFQRVAEDARTQKAYASRSMLNGQLGNLESAITGLAGQKDLQDISAELRKQLTTLGQTISEAYPPPVTDQAAEVELFLNNLPAWIENRERTEQVYNELMAGGKAAESAKEKLAKFVADPRRQEWALSNGYNLGTVQRNPDGTVNVASYMPSKDDIKAAYTFVYQQRNNKPEQLIRSHNTGQWAEVEVSTDAKDVSIQGSKFESLLGLQPLAPTATNSQDPNTPGRDVILPPDGKGAAKEKNAAANPPKLFAYTTNDEGERIYLDSTQLDDIIARSMQTDKDPIAFTDAAGLPYVYFPASGGLYEVDANKKSKTFKQWVKSDKRLEDVGQSATAYSGQAAIMMQGDKPVMADESLMVGMPMNNVSAASSTISEDMDRQRVMAELEKSGVVLDSKPPETPTYKTYGKVIRMHATDPAGSIRIENNGGETLYTKDQLVNVKKTAYRSDTDLPMAVSTLMGRRNERIAKSLRDNPYLSRRRLNGLDYMRASWFPDDVTRQPDAPEIPPALVEPAEGKNPAIETVREEDRPFNQNGQVDLNKRMDQLMGKARADAVDSQRALVPPTEPVSFSQTPADIKLDSPTPEPDSAAMRHAAWLKSKGNTTPDAGAKESAKTKDNSADPEVTFKQSSADVQVDPEVTFKQSPTDIKTDPPSQVTVDNAALRRFQWLREHKDDVNFKPVKPAPIQDKMTQAVSAGETNAIDRAKAEVGKQALVAGVEFKPAADKIKVDKEVEFKPAGDKIKTEKPDEITLKPAADQITIDQDAPPQAAPAPAKTPGKRRPLSWLRQN